jgi:hypothetical protein
MSQGFLALNNGNQVLVSSDTRNLHFIGKAALVNVKNEFYTHGGSRIFVYRISSPVPVVPFFTMPTYNFYGITAIRDIGGSTWEIEVLMSGVSYASYVANEPASGFAYSGTEYVVLYATYPDWAYVTSSGLVWGGVGTTLPGRVPATSFTLADGWTYTWSGASPTGWMYYPGGYGAGAYYFAYFPVRRSRVVYYPIPSPAPEVYVFADPRAGSRTETHGMAVYRNDGTAAFDSRLRPLAITGGVSVVPPYSPKPSLPYGLDPTNCASTNDYAGGAFAPDQAYSFGVSITPAKPIFSFASLPQAEREASYSRTTRECDGVNLGKGGCAGAEREYRWTSNYWSFYRGGIRRNGNQIDAGWVTVSFGCNWTYTKDSAFIGIGTGGSSGAGGTWPYSNETLNLVYAPVIIADGSRYD